jgi:hypothetical protein
MPVNPPQPNMYNPQPYYGNIGGMNRLAAMGAQAGSPYFQFTGRPNINQGDVLSALQQQFGGRGGMFPGLTSRGMYAAGGTSSESSPFGAFGGGGGANPINDPSSIWYRDPTGYNAYAAAQKQKMTGGAQPWTDPNSEWYGNEGGYRSYLTQQQGISSGTAQQRLDEMAHRGMTWNPLSRSWTVPTPQPTGGVR